MQSCPVALIAGVIAVVSGCGEGGPGQRTESARTWGLLDPVEGCGVCFGILVSHGCGLPVLGLTGP